MGNLIEILYSYVNSWFFLGCVSLISLSLKFIFLMFVILRGLKTEKTERSWSLLLLIFIGAMMTDATWIIYSLKNTILPTIDRQFVMFAIRITWAFYILLYHSLGLFIETLTNKEHRVSNFQKILLSFSTAYACIFLYLAFFRFNSIALENENMNYILLNL